jgi:4-amino-4-deoxy-L-arabinose transferase-like glycosyltransferase
MWRLMLTRSWTWAIVLGLAVGVGMLAKYAMLYFVLCTAMAAYWMAPVREALKAGRALAASLVALVIIAPNLIWNVQNGFATARLTASNAHFDSGDLFNLNELVEFIVGQAGVLGPVLFIVLIGVAWTAWRRSSGLTDQDKFLISYILPPFLFVSVIAFISRANVNWVAVAYPAAVLWFTGAMFAAANGKRTLGVSLVINVAIGLSFAYIVTTMPALANRRSRRKNRTACPGRAR